MLFSIERINELSKRTLIAGLREQLIQLETEVDTLAKEEENNFAELIPASATAAIAMSSQKVKFLIEAQQHISNARRNLAFFSAFVAEHEI